MSGMTADNGEAHLVLCQQLVELPPMLVVLEGLELFSLAAAPVIAFPAGEPFPAPLGDVFAVGDDLDLGAALQGLEPLNQRLKFHPVIGRFGLSPRSLDHLAAGRMLQNIRPTSWSGIPRAGAVGEESDERKSRRPGCRVAHVYRSRNVIRPRFGS